MVNEENVMPNQDLIDKAKKELESILERVDEALESLQSTEKVIASKEKELKKIEDAIGLTPKLGFFGEHVDFSDLYSDYQENATTRNGLNKAEFAQFLSVIIYFNNAINGETKSVIMNGESVQLHDIPFDSRLNAILTPASVTFDVYDVEMYDFKHVDNSVKCDISLEYWIRLQQKFFRNWKNKNVDESSSLKDAIKRVTLQQVGKRIFFNDGTGKSASNYWRPESGEIYEMPINIATKLWDVHGDCISYNEAVFRTFHAMYGRIVTN